MMVEMNNYIAHNRKPDFGYDPISNATPMHCRCTNLGCHSSAKQSVHLQHTVAPLWMIMTGAG